MWKAQHPGGQREINELHVPAGQDVRLVMASQDVIHSFYIPALRIKQDVVPGRYETMWFRADKPGRYTSVLRRILRDRSCPYGRLADGHGTAREFADWLRSRAGRRRLPPGRRPVPPLWLQRLPRAGRHRARAAARGRVRKPGAACRTAASWSPTNAMSAIRSSTQRRKLRPATRPSCRPSPGRSARTISPSLVAYIQSIGTSRRAAAR